MKKDRNILILQLLSLTVAGANGAFMNFINLYLEQVVGLSGTEIGLVAMISMALLIVVNPIWGFIGDKTGKHVLLFKLSFFATIFMAAVYFNARTLVAVLVVATLFEASRAAIMPFFDLITTDYCEKVKFDFGRVRVFSSFGFMTSTMGAGFVVGGLSFTLFGRSFGFDGFLNLEHAMFGIFIFLMSVSALLAFFVPKPRTAVDESEISGKKTPAKKFSKEDAKLLFSNKKYLYILVFIALSLVTLEAAKAYLGNHMVMELGTNENIMSWLTLVMVAPELLLMPLGSKLIRKVGFKKWYIFAVSTMIVRMAIYSFATSVPLIVIASLVHGLGITTHVAGNIAYIRKVVPANVMGLAFTVMVSFMAMCRAVLSFLFGTIYDHIDGFTVFRVTTVVLTVALLWVIKSKNLKEVGDEITATS